MARNIVTALDVGTATVQTVVAEKVKGEQKLRVLGVGVASSSGVRRGTVVDAEEAAAAIRDSVAEARRSSGIPIRSVWVGVGGSHISVSSSRGVVAVSRADGEISPEDVRRAIMAAETFVARNPNKEVLHIIPRDFKVDQESGIKDPVGMHGIRLEADAMIIECSAPLLKNLIKSVEQAGLTVEDYVFSPLASSEAILTKRQKEIGVALLDIGGGTASFIVFEEGVPLHAGVVPIGGNHITHDVAIGFKTKIDVAERIKIAHASCLLEGLSKKEQIRLADYIPEETATYSKKELAEIVVARLGDVFELVEKELRKIDKDQLLPSGVVLSGGSSLIPGLIELAKKEIRLPVELGVPYLFQGIDERIAPQFSTVLGVAHWAYTRTATDVPTWRSKVSRFRENRWMKWFRALLP